MSVRRHHRSLYLAFFYLVAILKIVSVGATGSARATPVATALAIAGLLFLAVALPVLRPQYRLTVLALLVAGVVLTVFSSATVSDWVRGLSSGSGFFVLFSGVMLVSRFLDAESVVGAPDEGPPLLLTGIIQFLASIGLSLGAVFVVRPLYGVHGDRPRSVFRTISGAYSANVAVSPLDAVVNLVIGLAGISYLAYLGAGAVLAGVLLAALALAGTVDVVRHRRVHRNRGRRSRMTRATGSDPRGNRRAVLALFARVGLLVAPVVIVHILSDTGERISLTGIVLLVLAPILILASRGRREFAMAVRSHPARVGGIMEVIAVLTSATIFSTLFSGTPLADRVVAGAGGMIAWSPYLGLTAIVFATALGAFFGLHMLVIVTTIGMTLSPELLHLSPAGFAGFLNITYMVGMNTSPLVPFTISAGEVNGGRSSLAATRALSPPWAVVGLLAPVVLLGLFGG